MQVGDPLELRFDILDPLSPYEIFVRDLVAKDGNDQNQGSDPPSRPHEGGYFKPAWRNSRIPSVVLPDISYFFFL